jgi:hypothetical protein
MSQHTVDAPALLRDECANDMGAKELRVLAGDPLRTVFGNAIDEREPGVWRSRRLDRDVHVRVEDDGAGSRMTVAIHVQRSWASRLVAAFVGIVAVGAWIVAALATFSDFRGAQSPEHLAVWLGSLVAAFTLTPAALYLVKSQRVSVNKALGQIEELKRSVRELKPRARIARGYRLEPKAVDVDVEVEVEQEDDCERTGSPGVRRG